MFAIYITNFCSKAYHHTITKMSPSVGKKTMTVSKTYAGYSSGRGTETIPGCQMLFLHEKCREVSVSVYEQPALCVQFPHRTVRGLGEKESDSHLTSLAPEQLSFILKQCLPLYHSFRHSANTHFSSHDLKHYFQKHNCSHPLINVCCLFAT